MSTQNPIDDAIDWYRHLVDVAIVDEHRPEGIVQLASVDKMMELVEAEPQRAQLAIQFIHSRMQQDAKLEPNLMLHGTWICMAYLMIFGKLDASSLILKKMAPRFYAKAIEELKRIE